MEKPASGMKIGFNHQLAIALAVISFLILLQSFDSDLLSLITAFTASFLTFVVSLALLAKIFTKLKLKKLIETAFIAFAVFFFIIILFLAVIGLMPASMLSSNWIVPFLLAIIMVFASFAFSSLAYFRAMRRIAPNASLRLLWFLFLTSMLLVLFVTSLFACGRSGTSVFSLFDVLQPFCESHEYFSQAVFPIE